MSWQAPNLARDPFVNQRPLVRASLLFAVAAIALTLFNVISYLRAGSGVATLATEITRLERETAASRARLATIDHDLANRDLVALNRKTEFVNARIEERTFSWNLLFTRLAEAQPRGVRLASLKPQFGKKAADGKSRAPVELHIKGEAEDGEALLEFVDKLFAHPAFDSPNLTREGRAGGGVTEFDLHVVYLPEPSA